MSASVKTADIAPTAALVDERLPTPLYHQVYLVLRNNILSGFYPFDSLLPGEQETSGTFGVSRITAKRALNELADDKFVVRQRGRGTRVIYRAPTPPVQASVEGLLENLMTMGLKTKVELLAFDYVRATDEVSRVLHCDKGCSVQYAVRVRRLEGVLFSHLTTLCARRYRTLLQPCGPCHPAVAGPVGALRRRRRPRRADDFRNPCRRPGLGGAGYGIGRPAFVDSPDCLRSGRTARRIYYSAVPARPLPVSDDAIAGRR